MIILPWPPAILNPNKIAHWAQKSKAKAKYKTDCYYIAHHLRTLEYARPFFYELNRNIPIKLIFNPPSKARRDIDNLLASMKSGLDGIAEGWGVNDCRFRPITIDFGDVVKGGSVELHIG